MESFPNHNLAGCLSCVKFHADSGPWARFLPILNYKHNKVVGQSTVNGDKLPIFLLVNVRTGPTFKLPQLFGSLFDSNHSFCVFLAGATAFQRTHEGCLILMQSRQSAKFRIPWCVTVCVTCTLITALANIKIISNRT